MPMTPPDSENTRPMGGADGNLSGAEFGRDEIIGGRYKVLSLLGKGGMGLVYRVEQIFLGKELALKTIHKNFLTETSIKRFELEARAAFAVNHPNIIAVKAFGLLDDQTPFLAMEIVNGETLAELLQDSGPLPMEAALPVVIQVCFGLAHAHDCGVVHRDIKPSNIMILKDLPIGTKGSVKILDFGIAKFSHREGGEIQALTKTGEIFGSPLYMSPEQCMGSQVDYRSDIYSLGCVIFETLTGKAPFVGNNALATLMMHQSEAPPSLAKASGREDFPEGLENIVAKMLAKQPEDRYQSLGTVANDLTSIINGSGSSRASRPISLSPSERAREAKAGSMPRRHLYILLSAISVIVICAVGIYSFFTYKQKKIESTAAAGREKLDDYKALTRIAHNKAVETTADLKEVTQTQLKAELAASDSDFELKSANVTANTLETITTAKQIHNLNFMGSNISNDSLDKLAKMNLTNLTLSNSNFNDLGAQKLAHVQTLRIIKANDTAISNQGLASLKKLKNLMQLKIEGTKVDINGVRNICQSKTLTKIALAHCAKIKEADRKLLKQEFPAIEFVFEGKFDEQFQITPDEITND